MIDYSGLDRLFNPRSVAIIGASSVPTKIGGLPIFYLRNNGFDGAIYPINPKASQIQGLKAYATIGEVAGKVDLTIVAVPAAAAAAAIDAAIAAGTQGIVLFSSGFSETGDGGARAQTAVVAKVRAAGVRLLGPNCIGFMNLKDRVFATFSPALQQGTPKVGRIGLVSQSGAYGVYAFALARERGIGLNRWITTGNEGDVDFADALAWLAKDPDTDVILGYMEGCRDGGKLQVALAAARDAGKPVVITKVGKTSAGAKAAASHTGALAGSDAIFDAVFRKYGVYRAHSIEEFFDIGYAFVTASKPAGKRLGVFTVSGGAGIVIADAAVEAGLELPILHDVAQEKIRELVPFAAARNPVDITGQITNDISLVGRAMKVMLADDGYDMLIAFMAAVAHGPLGVDMAEQIVAVRRRYLDKVFCAVSIFTDEVRASLEQAGCLVFEDPARAVRALDALARFPKVGNYTGCAKVNAGTNTEPIPLEARSYSESESFALLTQAGVPCPHTWKVQSAKAAAAVAQEAARPLVAKISATNIAHKSDIGGVCLNLDGGPAVAAAYAQIINSVRLARPDADIDGVLLSPMETNGIECIVGVKSDPVFGPVIMLGLGGVFVEVLKDVSFRVAPIDRDDAFTMVEELRGKALLRGVRGQPPADVEALVDLLVKVSGFAMAAGYTLDSLDINPVLVRPQGCGVVALDALIIGRGQ